MFKNLSLIVCLSAILSSIALANVSVTSPSNGSTIQGAVHYVATATTTTCSKGVGSMGIYTSPGVLAYVVNGASLNTNLNLNPGTYNTTVEEWDNCGGATTAGIKVTVTGSGSSGVTVTSPSNNSDSGSPVQFTATATTTCSKGVS